ncbi:MAG TPA: ABC transporter permease [Lachnospiraceae bacterium]|nr:ABC transporter permease [Lachnospiraceae bacterium]
MYKRSVSYPCILWSAAFIIIPLLFIFYYGLTDRTGAFTLSNLAAIATAENSKALILSLGLSLLSTAICLLLAYPLALILSGSKIGRSGFIIFLFVLPMWMNFLLRTLAWVVLLDTNGVLDTLCKLSGLPRFKIINTPAAIVFGMVYDFLPFMILPIYNVISKIDINVVNAARDLGANSFQTLYKVIFPLSLPGVISGITMVFVPSLTTFVISTLLGGGKILLIGNVIEQEFMKGTSWHVGSGLSLVLMLFIIVSMALSTKYDNGEGNVL